MKNNPQIGRDSIVACNHSKWCHPSIIHTSLSSARCSPQGLHGKRPYWHGSCMAWLDHQKTLPTSTTQSALQSRAQENTLDHVHICQQCRLEWMDTSTHKHTHSSGVSVCINSTRGRPLCSTLVSPCTVWHNRAERIKCWGQCVGYARTQPVLHCMHPQQTLQWNIVQVCMLVASVHTRSPPSIPLLVPRLSLWLLHLELTLPFKEPPQHTDPLSPHQPHYSHSPTHPPSLRPHTHTPYHTQSYHAKTGDTRCAYYSVRTHVHTVAVSV